MPMKTTQPPELFSRSVRKIYTESLIGRGDITIEEAEQALRDYQQELERAFTETKDAVSRPADPGVLLRPQPDDEILADYAADQPQLLADLLLDSDELGFGVLLPQFLAHGDRELPLLQDVLMREPPPDAPEGDREHLAKRQANAVSTGPVALGSRSGALAPAAVVPAGIVVVVA